MYTPRFRVTPALGAIFVMAVSAARIAEAYVVGSATLVKNPSAGIPFEGPEAGLGALWISYELRVQTIDEMATISALQVEISGPLHQRWSDFDGNGVFEATPNNLDISEGDSHLNAVALVFSNGPSEDNSGFDSPLADTPNYDFGVGTMLSATWSIPFADLASSASLAYIVVPKGTESQLDMTVKVLYGYGHPAGHETVGELDEHDFFPIVPEPASAILGGMALFGLASIVRRRIGAID